MTRMIFCLTTGRSGTMYLARVLNTIPGVESRHEPLPRWWDQSRKSHHDRMVWLFNQKLPEIYRTCPNGEIYVETANQINQGYIELLLEGDIRFDAIWLRRDLQEVAISFWRRNIIAGRTHLGWHMRPDYEENVLRAEHWEHWTDYMCCLWLAMEKDARSAKYAPMIRDAGGQVVETWTKDIVTEIGLHNLLKELNLSDPDGKYHEIKNRHMNATKPDFYQWWPPEGIGRQRETILKECGR